MDQAARISQIDFNICFEAFNRAICTTDISIAFVDGPVKELGQKRRWVSLADFPEKTSEPGKMVFAGLAGLPRVVVSYDLLPDGFLKLQLEMKMESLNSSLVYDGHRIRLRYRGQPSNNRQSFFSSYSFAFNGVLPEVTRPLKLTDGAPPISRLNRILYKERRGVAWWVTALKADDSFQALFLGALSAEILKTTFTIEKQTNHHLVTIYQGLQGDYLPLTEKAAIVADAVVIHISEAILQTMEDYGALVGKISQARAPQKSARGWSSWYKYYPRIDEDIILKEAAQLKLLLKDKGFDLLQIDDGYQTNIGDWQAVKPGFSGGMKALATKIIGEGLRPGVWLAPFMVDKNSQLAKRVQNENWFLRDYKNQLLTYSIPGHSKNYILDISHPDVQSWLSQTIRMYREWGFNYLKIDFLFLAATAAKRFNPQMSGMAAYRQGLKIIRQAAGEETTLLLSGSMDLAAVGVADANRLGPDIAYDFAGGGTRLAFIKAQMSASAAHFFMGHRWFTPNADALMVRPPLKDSLAEMMIAQVAMTGGDYILSDDMASVAGARLEKLTHPKILSLQGGDGHFKPLDYFEHQHKWKIPPNPLMWSAHYGVPQIWLWSSKDGDRQMLFLFNFEGRESLWNRDLNGLTIEVCGKGLFKDGEYKDIYQGETLRIEGGRAQAKLPAHGVRIFSLQR